MKRARELPPDGCSALEEAIAQILHGAMTSVDYGALKKIFAKDPDLGEKVPEHIALLQPGCDAISGVFVHFNADRLAHVQARCHFLRERVPRERAGIESSPRLR